MKLGKVYAYGKHAVEEAKHYAAHAVLKIFTDKKEGEVAQISLFKLMPQYDDFVRGLETTPATSLVLLAGVEDPHNVGAIVRSAAAFGVAAVLIPEHGQAPVTDTVLKVSAGMAFRVPLVSVTGVQQVLSDLKKRGFKVAALEGTAKHSLNDEAFDEPVVFVFGNEGAGIPGPVKPLCDKALAIPIHPRAESLNVAAAAAVTLGAWAARHPEALR